MNTQSKGFLMSKYNTGFHSFQSSPAYEMNISQARDCLFPSFFNHVPQKYDKQPASLQANVLSVLPKYRITATRECTAAAVSRITVTTGIRHAFPISSAYIQMVWLAQWTKHAQRFVSKVTELYQQNLHTNYSACLNVFPLRRCTLLCMCLPLVLVS